MKILIRSVSVLGVLLGGLWLVQGLGLVQIRPILCFADCEPVQGSSALPRMENSSLVAPRAGSPESSIRMRTASERSGPNPVTNPSGTVQRRESVPAGSRIARCPRSLPPTAAATLTSPPRVEIQRIT